MIAWRPERGIVSGMRNTLLLLGALAVLTPAPISAAIDPNSVTEHAQSDYNAGWKEGWEAGWKYVAGKYSYPDYPPYPPYPDYGRDSYQDGYNDGFLAGMAAANKKR